VNTRIWSPLVYIETFNDDLFKRSSKRSS